MAFKAFCILLLTTSLSGSFSCHAQEENDRPFEEIKKPSSRLRTRVSPRVSTLCIDATCGLGEEPTLPLPPAANAKRPSFHLSEPEIVQRTERGRRLGTPKKEPKGRIILPPIDLKKFPESKASG